LIGNIPFHLAYFKMPYTKLTPEQATVFLKHNLTAETPAELRPRYIQPIQQTTIDPTIPGQTYVGISFAFDDESVKNAQKVDELKGFFNVRYVSATTDQMDQFCDGLCRKVDSIFPVNVAKVGHWTSVQTNNDSIEQKLVSDDPQQQQLLQSMYDQKAEQQRRDREEVEERRRVAMQDAIENRDKPYDRESLDHYVTKRVSKWNIERHLATFQEQKRRYKQAKKSFIEIKKELAELEQKHPEFLNQYQARFEQERRALGMSDHPTI
jgi:hypothetical protein